LIHLRTCTLGAGVSGLRYSVGKVIFLFCNTSRPALGLTQPASQWRLAFFTCIRRPGREVCHAPSLDEVKNEWSYTYALHVCLDDVDRNNGTFHFYQNVLWICTNRRQLYFLIRRGCESFDIVEDILDNSLFSKRDYRSIGILYAGHIMRAELLDDCNVCQNQIELI